MKSSLPILIVVLCVAMYFMYISPTVSEIKGLTLKKAEYDNVLLKANELKEKRDAILIEYTSIPEEQIARLNKIISQKYESVIFANDVNNLSSKFGLVVKGIRDDSSTTGDRTIATEDTAIPYKTNTITITLSGAYDQFVKFLDALESNIQLIDVKSLTIGSSKDEKATVATYEFVLGVTIYSLN